MKTLTADTRKWKEDPEIRGASKAIARGGDSVDRRDVAAFEESVGRCEDKAYRLAALLVRSESAAQEILQETFLSAWQNMRSFAGRAQFEDWVFRAIAKAALGRMKFARGQGLTSIEKCIPSIRTNPRSLSRSLAREDADWVLRPSDQRGSEELYRHIRDTVDSLPDEQRAVFVLCDLEGMSAANSAEILELPVTTTAANLQTARLAVRDTIGRHFSKGDIN